MKGRPKIVVLGMMSKMPVAGVAWQTLHYVVGFERLGYDVYYVEAHARTPSMLMESEEDDSSAKAAAFIDRVLRPFGLSGRWAFHALHDDGRCYGMSEQELKRVYASAELVINLHGGTRPLPEHAATGRLVYLETDPVQLQVELDANLQQTIDFLDPHTAFFTFAENLGAPDCNLPVPKRFHFRPTRQPVVLDFWRAHDRSSREIFTTVANWKQPWRDVSLEGETYVWSKHREFLKFVDVPRRTGRAFELALAGCEGDERRQLEEHGWRVCAAEEISTDLDHYRDYILESRGEFTVAKDQNVRLRTGWFSDRSATYLAVGAPVVMQDTGFGNVLPTGEGLFPFSTIDEAVYAIGEIEIDYTRHSRKASEIARDYFGSDVVLARLLEDVGVPPARGRRRDGLAFPPDLVLEPVRRRPLVLPDATVAAVLTRPLPASARAPAETVSASIVVVTHDNLALTRLSLESVLATGGELDFEIVAVDNASSDGTTGYIRELADRHASVCAIINSENVGFPAACNQGLAAARGGVVVLLNNDTIVAPGWLRGLASHLEDRSVGAVGPVTNRIGNEAEIEAPYRTYGEFLKFAARRASEYAGKTLTIPMPAMFCLALRRDVVEEVGPLDERFGIGTLEDDDYALRLQAAGYRTICAEDVFVHHFGQGSFGKLFSTGEYGRLLESNRERFEDKWGRAWQPYLKHQSDGYERVKAHVRVATAALAGTGPVLVVSKGDDELVHLNGRPGWHFPQTENGIYAGHHPRNDEEAVVHVEELRAKGAEFLVFPKTSFWWLDYYRELGDHLNRRYRTVLKDAMCVIYDLRQTMAE